MKRFCILLLSIVILSCSNDDDTATREQGLQGTWNLVNVSGGFSGINEDIDRGVIVWDFNETTNMVTITNTIMDNPFNTILPSGTYSYSVVAPADTDTLVINEVNYGAIEIENTVFSIAESFSDGLVFRFER